VLTKLANKVKLVERTGSGIVTPRVEALRSTIPGYRVNEYLLVLKPHEELRQRIGKVKEHFAETYKTGLVFQQAQVSLLTFSQYEMMEERIVTRLRAVAMAFPPFKVELKDFGSFPSHSIFIHVTSKIPIQQLVKTIRTDAQRLMKMGDDKFSGRPHFIMEPYITIAGKLKPWQYEKGWLEYSNRHFSGKFIADSMTLLKREAGESRYHLVGQFKFQHLPVTTKQGELFG